MTLHDEISALLRQVEDDPDAERFRDRWNFITDINTNEIRPEGKLGAYRLLADLKEYCDHD